MSHGVTMVFRKWLQKYSPLEDLPEGALSKVQVYDAVQNSWKNLPDMPEAGHNISCVAVKNQIFITIDSQQNYKIKVN